MRGAVWSTTKSWLVLGSSRRILGVCQALDHVVKQYALQANMDEGKGLECLRIRDEQEALGTSLWFWRTWFPACILSFTYLPVTSSSCSCPRAAEPRISSSPLLRLHTHTGPAEDDQPLVYQSTGSRFTEISGHLPCASSKIWQHRFEWGLTSRHPTGQHHLQIYP